MGIFKTKRAKSTQSSTSENINNPLITSTYGGTMNQGVGASNFLAKLLGVVPDTGGEAASGYNNYLQMAGYAPALRNMTQNVTGQAAAAGLLNSGPTREMLLRKGGELDQQFYNNYLQQLAGLSGIGTQAGSLVANTGQKSTSTGTSVGGAPSTFSDVASGVGKIANTAGKLFAFFSDRRLKRDIVLEGREPDGLGIYSFRYVGDDKRRRGVMADEVARIRPHALGPEKAGYATVDYARL